MFVPILQQYEALLYANASYLYLNYQSVNRNILCHFLGVVPIY